MSGAKNPMTKFCSFISKSFHSYVDSLKPKKYFNFFSADQQSNSFLFAFLFEVIVYALIWVISIFLLDAFYDTWIVPIMFILYYIPFYSFISRTLIGKYKKPKIIAIICIGLLIFTILEIVSFALYFFYIHDNRASVFFNYETLLNCIFFFMEIGTLVNLFTRIALVVLSIFNFSRKPLDNSKTL